MTSRSLLFSTCSRWRNTHRITAPYASALARQNNKTRATTSITLLITLPRIAFTGAPPHRLCRHLCVISPTITYISNSALARNKRVNCAMRGYCATAVSSGLINIDNVVIPIGSFNQTGIISSIIMFISSKTRTLSLRSLLTPPQRV